MSPRGLVSALAVLTHARRAQHVRRRQKPRGRGTKAAATLAGERLEPRLALAIDFASGLAADMTASAYLFIGDHSVSNSEIWRMNVAGTPLTAPGYGLVLREQGTFVRGASYPITVDWLASNRSAGPDYDYRAWIDRSANPTWTSGSPTPSSPDFFVTDPGQLLQRRWFGSEVNATLGKTAEVHFPGIDLDGDSDNSGSVDGTQSEDALELVSTTGVNVPVSTSSMAGLTPLVLGMSDNLRHAATAADVSFTFSTTAPTAFRLWGDAARTQLLPWGTAVTAAQLGLGFGSSLNLQLEAIAPTTSFAAITTTALVTGGFWQGTLQDTVRARGVPGVDLDVDSDNTGSIARSIVEDAIEDDTASPGLIVPVGGSRAPMIVDVPQGRTASLAITQGADKVRLWTAQTGGTAIPAAGSTVAGGAPQTFWIEAVAPSASLADIAFTLTVPGTGLRDSITMTNVEVVVDRINFKGDGNIDIRIDKTTDIGNAGLPGYAATEDVEWIRNSREKKNEDDTAWDTTQSAPAAFVKNKALSAEVHFAVTPAVSVEALKIKADSTQPYGAFESTTVTYAALPGGGGEYKATFTTPAASKVDEVDVNTKVFSWKVESITVTGKTYDWAVDLRKTEHRLYTVLGTPVAPMAEPWATVLEVTSQLADGAKTGAEVVAALTIGTHDSKWSTVTRPFVKATATLIYDPRGAIRTTNGGGWTTQQFDLVSLMTSLTGATTKQQCDDNANTVAIFARSLGVAAKGLRFYGPGFTTLEPTTYFPAGSNTIEPPVNFNFHQIVQFDGKVYDPSTRKDMGGDPWVGMTFDDYLDAAFPGQRAKGRERIDVTVFTIK